MDQYQAARTLYTKHRGPEDPDTLRGMCLVASGYLALTRNAEAVALLEATLPLMKAKLGPDDGDTLRAADVLATSYGNLGRHTEALKLREETLALRKAKLGPDHRDTLRSMGSLAGSYYWLGRPEESLKLRKETLALQKATLGPTDPETLVTMDALAMTYHKFGQDTEALPLFEETLALRKAKLGPNQPATVWSMVNLAEILATAGDAQLRDPPRALELAKRAVELQPYTDGPRSTYGIAQYRTGDWKGTVTELENTIGQRRPDAHSDNAHDGFFLAMAYWHLGEKDRARQWFARSVQWMDKAVRENAVLKRDRAEAAALLGMDKKD
jgi:tetratricopeptide (TPR) repeat protein